MRRSDLLPIRRVVLATVVVVAVAAPVRPASAHGRLKSGEEAQFTIPRMTAAPDIDGTIDAAEWKDAAAVSGVVAYDNDVLIPRPTTFFFAWDPQHFYFACRTYVRPNYKPNIPEGRSEGKAYCYDDGLELIFKPYGKNVDAGREDMAYRMFLNCLGYMGDLTRLAVGQQIKNWQPNFRRAVRLTEPGTAPDGGSWWELEVSTSLDDFELVGPHQAGDTWRLMCVFNHMPIFIQPRLPAVGSFFTPEGKCLATLVENTPVVKMTMDSLSNLASDGTAALVVSAYNPTPQQQTVKVDVDVAGKIVKSETLELPAGEERALTLNEKLPEDVKKGEFTVRATYGKTSLLAYRAFFEVGRFNDMLEKVEPPDPDKFEFTTRYNPVSNRLLVKADTYRLPDPEAARELVYTVRPENGGDPVAEGRIRTNIEWYIQDILGLPKLTPGEYTVSGELVLQDGTRLGPIEKKFAKKDEAAAFPHWWGKKFGDIERVLPPYTALRAVEVSGVSVQVSGKTKAEQKAPPDTRNLPARGSPEGEVGKPETYSGFALLGREYAFDALGLPRAISSRGEAVLAAPARIVVTVDGKENVIPVGAPEIVEKTGWRVQFEGKAKGAGVYFEARGWLEQDGLVYVDLTYGPAGTQPVKVDALRIEYPLSEFDADCLLCIGPGNNYSSKTTMFIPDDKQGLLWSTLDPGRSGSQMTIGSFYPTVWIGNDRRGFLWWADNDKGWVQENEVPAQEALRAEVSGFSVQEPDEKPETRPMHQSPLGTVQGKHPTPDTCIVLRNNIVAKPTTLAAPRTISFSYIATPFKPLPKGWRTTLASTDGTFFEPFHAMAGITDPATGEKISGGEARNWIHPNSRHIEYWDKEWAEWKKGADAAVAAKLPWDPWEARHGVNFVHNSFQIMGYGTETGRKEALDYFGDEWHDGWWETHNETMLDHLMWLFDLAFSKGGLRSTYWDLAFPIPFHSELSGLAYRLPDGRTQPGYNGWNIRRFHMRLWALQDKYGLNPGAVEQHATHAYIMVSLPWVDSVLDGERAWNLDTSDYDWVDYYPPAQIRSMAVAHNWGVPVNWIGIVKSQSIEKVHRAKRAQAEYLWMHDAWFQPSLTNQMGGEEYRTFPRELLTMPDPVLDWGLNGVDVEYHPYWRNPYAGCEDKDVLVSLWRIGNDRVLIGVFNHDSKSAKDVSVSVELDKLRLVPELIWQEFIRTRDLYKRPDTPRASLDFHGRALNVKELAPHEGRFVGIRRY
jgi:hypothetical protein